MARRNAVRRPTPGSFESSPTTSCKSFDGFAFEPPLLSVGNGDLAPVVEAVGDLDERPLVQHEEVGRRLVGRTLHGRRERHHDGLRIVEHLTPLAHGEPAREHEHRHRDEGSVEPRLAQRQTLCQQVGEEQRQGADQRREREDAPCRAAHQTAHAAHPFGEEKFGYLLDVVLRAGLGDTQIIADVVVAGSQPQGPVVEKDRLAQPPLLETDVGQVVIEFHGTQSAGENLLVELRGGVEVAIDIGRVGAVPQLLGRRFGSRFRSRRHGRLRQRVGSLLRMRAEHAGQQDQE